jgi:hypothetical protein
MKRIRIQRPRARRERDWGQALPPDPRDPDVVRAKALACAGDRAGRRTARQSHSPGLPRRRADSSPPGGSPGEQFDPFKFLIYAELAGVETGPVE